MYFLHVHVLCRNTCIIPTHECTFVFVWYCQLKLEYGGRVIVTKSVALLGLLSFLVVCIFFTVATISAQMVESVIEDGGNVMICSTLEGPADGLAIIVEVTADTVNGNATGKIQSTYD